MEKYPDHFIDVDGYEWQRGSFVDPEDKIRILRWRFRPTKYYKLWKKLDKTSKQWDYTSEQNMLIWDIKISKKLV